MENTKMKIDKFDSEINNCMDAIAFQHSKLLEEHPNAYVEICVTRGTDVNSWLTTDLVDDNPNRKVIHHSVGQGCFNRAARNLSKNSPLFGEEEKVAHPKYRRQEATLKLFNKYDEIMREEFNLHYLQFYLYCKPSVGWRLELNSHWDEKRDDFETYVEVTSRTHTELLDQAFIEIERYIEQKRK